MVDIQRMKRRQEERAQGIVIDLPKQERAQKIARIQSKRDLYINRRNATLGDWLALHNITFDAVIDITSIFQLYQKDVSMIDDVYNSINLTLPFRKILFQFNGQHSEDYCTWGGIALQAIDNKIISASVCYNLKRNVPHTLLPKEYVFELSEGRIIAPHQNDLVAYNNPIDPRGLLAFGNTFIALKAVSLINTSNIELIDQQPNSRHSEIHEREYDRPLITYKVLKVNTGHKEYYGRDKDTGLRDFDPRRMHVVRGHHAEYGTNGRKLLFGKYQRKIWIPAHVRGNEELGIVVKDYEVVNAN